MGRGRTTTSRMMSSRSRTRTNITDAAAAADADFVRIAEAYNERGIMFDEASGTFWCVPCTNRRKQLCVLTVGHPQGGANTADSASFLHHHCASAPHIASLEEWLGIEEFTPVEINGRAMLMDHAVIYPAAMFGSGTMLFNETVKALVSVDVCGGVKLMPCHRYTVVRLARSDVNAEVFQQSDALEGGESGGFGDNVAPGKSQTAPKLNKLQQAQKHFIKEPVDQGICGDRGHRSVETPSGVQFYRSRTYTERRIDNTNYVIEKERVVGQELQRAMAESELGKKQK